ncbi:MAG: polysaccharide deacetylase family protein [Sedimentisphaerales bacterium]|nr:polysaccharide deacetylase family protein [Sedimentisphaerales bacterium]
MKDRKRLYFLLAVLLTAGLLPILSAVGDDDADSAPGAGKIRLLVRADDIGSSHAANVACIKSCREGIARSVEVMVPCPWFNEAVKLLNENPGIDVGVHLTLTSEWENCKWGPVTHAPSLVDEQGHFFPTTRQRSDFPPNTGFLEAGPKIEEVEKELRAQIELAVKKIPQVSHLSSHMGTPTSTPEFKALVQRLAKEYKLAVQFPGTKGAGGFGDSDADAEERVDALVRLIDGLKPGTWILVEHPGLDTPEMRSLGHKGYWNVASHRDGVTRAFTSEKVKEVIKKRKIELISYSDLSGD